MKTEFGVFLHTHGGTARASRPAPGTAVARDVVGTARARGRVALPPAPVLVSASRGGGLATVGTGVLLTPALSAQVVLRVLFPDRYILQGFFRPSETGKQLPGHL